MGQYSKQEPAVEGIGAPKARAYCGGDGLVPEARGYYAQFCKVTTKII
jgi:hypothetical protein